MVSYFSAADCKFTTASLEDSPPLPCEWQNTSLPCTNHDRCSSWSGGLKAALPYWPQVSSVLDARVPVRCLCHCSVGVQPTPTARIRGPGPRCQHEYCASITSPTTTSLVVLRWCQKIETVPLQPMLQKAQRRPCVPTYAVPQPTTPM